MKIKELIEKMNYYKIPENWYCIGEEAQFCDCLVCENNKWLIFNMERGKRTNIREFLTEEEACENLFEMEMFLLEHNKEIFE